MIIGRGSESDRASLKLFTTSNRTYIENERPEGEKSPETLRAALEFVLKVSPSAKCRSLTSMYNCVGLVFASRRTVVDADHLETILRDDGYRRIPREDVHLGDLVVYRHREVATHVGIVYEVKNVAISDTLPRREEVWLLSAWGTDGEYIHKMDEVPPIYGDRKEFWTERRPA